MVTAPRPAMTQMPCPPHDPDALSAVWPVSLVRYLARIFCPLLYEPYLALIQWWPRQTLPTNDPGTLRPPNYSDALRSSATQAPSTHQRPRHNCPPTPQAPSVHCMIRAPHIHRMTQRRLPMHDPGTLPLTEIDVSHVKQKEEYPNRSLKAGILHSWKKNRSPSGATLMTKWSFGNHCCDITVMTAPSQHPVPRLFYHRDIHTKITG